MGRKAIIEPLNLIIHNFLLYNMFYLEHISTSEKNKVYRLVAQKTKIYDHVLRVMRQLSLTSWIRRPHVSSCWDLWGPEKDTVCSWDRAISERLSGYSSFWETTTPYWFSRIFVPAYNGVKWLSMKYSLACWFVEEAGRNCPVESVVSNHIYMGSRNWTQVFGFIQQVPLSADYLTGPQNDFLSLSTFHHKNHIVLTLYMHQFPHQAWMFFFFPFYRILAFY